MASKDKLISSAQKFLAKGQLPKAIGEYQKLVASFPKDVRNRQKLAELLSREKRVEEALAEYEHVANHYADNGFYLKAIAVYKQMQKLDPARVEIYQKLAGLNEKQGLVGNALTEYRTLVTYYEQNGIPSEAMPILEKMLALDPTSLNIRAKLAEIMFATKAEHEAAEFFLELLGHLQENREFGKIVKLYDRFQEHLSDEAATSRPLAEALLVNNQPEKAVQLFKKLLKSAPEDLQILHFLGKGYMGLEDYENARLTYRHLARLEPENIETRERLTRACLAANDPGKALEAVEEGKEYFFRTQRFELLQELYEGILEQNPDNSRAVEALEEVREVFGRQTEERPEPDSEPAEVVSDAPASGEPTVDREGDQGAARESSTSIPDEKPDESTAEKGRFPGEVVDSSPELELDLDLELDLPDAEEARFSKKEETDGPRSEKFLTDEQDKEPDLGDTPPAEDEDGELEIELEIDLDGLDALQDLEAEDAESAEGRQTDDTEAPDEAQPEGSEATEKSAVEPFPAVGGFPADDDADHFVTANEANFQEPGNVPEDEERAPQPETAESAETSGTEQTSVYEEMPAERGGDFDLQPTLEEQPEESDQTEEIAESEALAKGAAVEAGTQVEDTGEVTEEPAVEGPDQLDEILELEEEPEELDELVDPAEPEKLEELEEVVESEDLEILEEADILDEENPELEHAQPESAQATEGKLQAELEDAAFYAQQGLFDDAERVLRSAIDEHGELPELMTKLADLDENRQTSVESDEVMDFSDLISELNDDELLDAADSLGSESPGDASQPEWTQELATELDSEDTESHYNLGIAYKEMGLYDDAVAEFNKASRDLFRRIDCLTLQAQCFLEMGNQDTAEQTFRQALALDGVSQEERVSLQYELGLFYRAIGRPLEALENFQGVADYDLFFRDVGEIVKSLRRELNLDSEPDNDEAARRNRDRISYI